MRLLGRDRAKRFARKHPTSRGPLRTWVQTIETNSFSSLVELNRVFGTADYVKPYTVFDIGGNKFRLITVVDYQVDLVSVLAVLTHAEYGRRKWRR